MAQPSRAAAAASAVVQLTSAPRGPARQGGAGTADAPSAGPLEHTSAAQPQHVSETVACQESVCQSAGSAGAQTRGLSRKARKRRNRKVRAAAAAAEQDGQCDEGIAASPHRAGVAARSGGKGMARVEKAQRSTAHASRGPRAATSVRKQPANISARGAAGADGAAGTPSAEPKNKFAARLKQRLPNTSAGVKVVGARALHGLPCHRSDDAAAAAEPSLATPLPDNTLSALEFASTSSLPPSAGATEQLVHSEPVTRPTAGSMPGTRCADPGSSRPLPAEPTAAASPPHVTSVQLVGAARPVARTGETIPTSSLRKPTWQVPAAQQQIRGPGNAHKDPFTEQGVGAPRADMGMPLAQRIRAQVTAAKATAASTSHVPDSANETVPPRVVSSLVRDSNIGSSVAAAAGTTELAPAETQPEIVQPAGHVRDGRPGPTDDDDVQIVASHLDNTSVASGAESLHKQSFAIQQQQQQQQQQLSSQGASARAAHISSSFDRECDVCGVEQDAAEFSGSGHTCSMCAAAIALDSAAATPEFGSEKADRKPQKRQRCPSSSTKHGTDATVPANALHGRSGSNVKRQRSVTTSTCQRRAAVSQAKCRAVPSGQRVSAISSHAQATTQPGAAGSGTAASAAGLSRGAGTERKEPQQATPPDPDVVILLPDIERPPVAADVQQSSKAVRGPPLQRHEPASGGLLDRWTDGSGLPHARTAGTLPLWLGGATAASQACRELPCLGSRSGAGDPAAPDAAANGSGAGSTAPQPLQPDVSRRAEQVSRGPRRRRVCINVEPVDPSATEPERSDTPPQPRCDSPQPSDGPPQPRPDSPQPDNAAQAGVSEASRAVSVESFAYELHVQQTGVPQPHTQSGSVQTPAATDAVENAPDSKAAFATEDLTALAADGAAHAALLALLQRSYEAGVAAAAARAQGALRSEGSAPADPAIVGADDHAAAEPCAGPLRPPTPVVNPADAEPEPAACGHGVALRAPHGGEDAEAAAEVFAPAGQVSTSEPLGNGAFGTADQDAMSRSATGVAGASAACDAQQGVGIDDRCSTKDSEVPVTAGASESAERRQEVEDLEWARRRQIIERQAAQARAEKEQRRRLQLRASMRARERAAATEQALVERIKAEKRTWLSRLFAPGMSVRQGLQSLNVAVGPGVAGERAALKRARVFYHPDSAKRRDATLEERVACEEVFKALGALRAG